MKAVFAVLIPGGSEFAFLAIPKNTNSSSLTQIAIFRVLYVFFANKYIFAHDYITFIGYFIVDLFRRLLYS